MDISQKASSEELDLKKEARGSIHGLETNPAAAALTAATEAQKPSMFSKGMLRLWLIVGIGYLISTMNGFDSSLMGSVNAMTQYQKTFGLSGAGSSTGLIFIIYNLGQIAAFPFCGLLADGYGRRWCIFIGCVLVCVGTAIQTSAHAQGQFMGGRFVLGFGAAIASAAGPAYIVELAHPSYRGFQAGMYNNFWWVGNILAGWYVSLIKLWTFTSPCTNSSLGPLMAQIYILTPRGLGAFRLSSNASCRALPWSAFCSSQSPHVGL